MTMTPAGVKLSRRRGRLQQLAVQANSTALLLGQTPQFLCVHPNDASLASRIAGRLGLAVRTTATIPPGELFLLEVCEAIPRGVSG